VEPAIWDLRAHSRCIWRCTSYLKPYRYFAADDDANGPVYFVRPLLDAVEKRGASSGAAGGTDPAPIAPIEPGDVAKAWLDYAREGAGMLWWGGYGKSTEHTAYLNLKNGSRAGIGFHRAEWVVPAEQIGGQIFFDTWGLFGLEIPEGRRICRRGRSVSTMARV